MIVTLDKVSKRYGEGPTSVYGIKDVSLSIERGDFLALCGPSGSGKSTVLNLIGALDIPTSGSIQLAGHYLEKLSASQLAHIRLTQLGFIFQSYNLIPVMSAFENTEFSLVLQGVAKEERRDRAMAALRAVGLESFADRRPHQLSGGQQQRVAIARALAPKPALILADEPTANLDSKTADSLLDLMMQLNIEQGATFVFSTHDSKVMARARTLCHLADGHLVDTVLRKQAS